MLAGGDGEDLPLSLERLLRGDTGVTGRELLSLRLPGFCWLLCGSSFSATEVVVGEAVDVWGVASAADNELCVEVEAFERESL